MDIGNDEVQYSNYSRQRAINSINTRGIEQVSELSSKPLFYTSELVI